MALTREQMMTYGIVGAAVVGVLLLTRRQQGESGAVTFLPVAPSEATTRASIEGSVALFDIGAQRDIALAEIFTSGEVAVAGTYAEERTRARELNTALSINESLTALERYRIGATERMQARELATQQGKSAFDFITEIFTTIGSYILGGPTGAVAGALAGGGAR